MSENIEMYLVRVAQLRQDDQPVPISQLAQELAVTSVSANEMYRKLVEKGLVEYEPYKGVTLTGDGEILAQRILRSRRLWTTFFTDALGFVPEAADEIACRFEHVTTDDLADRLASYLARRTTAPAVTGEPAMAEQPLCLSEVSPGQRGDVVAVATDTVTSAFLRQQGVIPGATAVLLALGSSGTLLVDVAGQPLALAPVLGQAIKVAVEDSL
ncbi:MAG: metal-dependent transcriptional regulator [Caldilineaceae bacterium]|nr:metal-dependent transcriptional regulator [Caldilineaceae bacterium]